MEHPKRAFQLKLDIGADDINALCNALDGIIFRLRSEGMIENIVSGGCDSGFIANGTHDPTMTHDRYFEDLKTWLKEQKVDDLE